MPGEASEIMVKLCLWPSIVLVLKLRYIATISGSLYVRQILCTRATKEGINANPTISLSGRQVFNFQSIVSQKRMLTPKYIRNSSALE